MTLTFENLKRLLIPNKTQQKTEEGKATALGVFVSAKWLLPFLYLVLYQPTLAPPKVCLSTLSLPHGGDHFLATWLEVRSCRTS